MASFEYEARSRAGKPVRGVCEAADRQAAVEQLRAEGLFLTRIEAQKGRSARSNSTASPPSGATPTSPLRGVPNPASAAASPPAATVAVSASVTVASLREQAAHAASVSPPAPAHPYPGAAAVTTPVGSAGQAPGRHAVPPLVERPGLRAGSKELGLFFRQLGSMVGAGTSIGKALGTMSQNASTPVMRRVSAEMQEQVMAGHQFSTCMQAFPGVFSELQRGMVSAGERGGFLERMLNRLADYSERDYALQTMVKRETFYPKMLVGAAILIPAAVPAVLALVNGGGVGGMAVAWLGSVLPWLLIGGGLYLVYLAVQRSAPYLLRDSTVREKWDGVKLSTPVVGKVTRGLAAAKFSRALGALYSAGVGPGESVRLAGRASGNAVVSRRAQEVIPRLEHGAGLTDSLESTGLFPGIALQMMRTGEETGMLDEQLEKAADFLEQDAETAIRQSIQVLGVVAFLAIAIVIGIQILSSWMGYLNNLNEVTSDIGSQ